jgi:uncharacterized protein YrrD
LNKMKKSQVVIGLPILSVSEGQQIGEVKDLVVNPQTFTIEYILINPDPWYLGLRAMAFGAVMGIGEHALTTEQTAAITTVSPGEPVAKLLDGEVRVKGTQVITKRGRKVGKIGDFYLDEETGKITGYELLSGEGDGVAGIIPAEIVVTLGEKMTVVEDSVDTSLVTELTESSGEAGGIVPPDSGASAAEAKSEAMRLFEERQRQYLLGRSVSKTIVDDSGNVLAAEGAEITEELLDQVIAGGRYLELSMNTRG